LALLRKAVRLNLALSQGKLGDNLGPDDLTIYQHGMVAFIPFLMLCN
jgi:hypothetical protein